MSRAQQGQIESTETANTATETAAANASQAAEQADIGTQQSQLAKFAANNPYVQGGQAQTVENQQLSGTADATAAGAAAKNQQQAQRTGQNASAGVAAGEAEAAQAQRTMGTQEAGATQSRLASGAQYGQDVLSGGNQIVAEQNSLGSQEANEAQGQASVGEQAAQTPSFLDELGQGLISGTAGAASAYAGKGCWVAAELYGGWDDPRVITLRAYLFGPFREHRLGRIITDLYAEYGERAAELMRRNRPVRWLLTRLCHLALRHAGRK